jgi:hypothetical protein
MLFRQEGKQLWRTPLRTLALCLALAVVTGLFAIAHGLLQASAHMREQVDANYTTVAYVPSRPGIYYNTGNKPQSSTNELFKAIKKGEFQSQVALSIDEHSRIAAYDPSLTPLISGSYADSTYDHDMDFPYNIGVFAATCTDKLFSRTTTQLRNEEIDGAIISIREKVDVYYYVFEVEKVIGVMLFGMMPRAEQMKTIGTFMLCYLLGVAIAVAQATSGKIMQTLKGKE